VLYSNKKKEKGKKKKDKSHYSMAEITVNAEFSGQYLHQILT